MHPKQLCTEAIGPTHAPNPKKDLELHPNNSKFGALCRYTPKQLYTEAMGLTVSGQFAAGFVIYTSDINPIVNATFLVSDLYKYMVSKKSTNTTAISNSTTGKLPSYCNQLGNKMNCCCTNEVQAGFRLRIFWRVRCIECP